MRDREEFEEWAKDKDFDVLPAASWHCFTYHSTSTEDAWRTWQARQPKIDALKTDVSTYRNVAECWRDRFNHQSDEKLKLVEENAALKAENERLEKYTEWVRHLEDSGIASLESFAKSPPTPPAQEDETVYQWKHPEGYWWDQSKRQHELDMKSDLPVKCPLRVLYTRPDNSALRKAAEALIWAYDNHEHCITEIGDLRAALEGK